jgi:hypothetical protein
MIFNKTYDYYFLNYKNIYIYIFFKSFQKKQNCSQLWDEKITWEKLLFKIPSNAWNCKCWIWCEWHWGLLLVMLIQETARLRFQTKWHQHLFIIILIWVNIFYLSLVFNSTHFQNYKYSLLVICDDIFFAILCITPKLCFSMFTTN